MCNQGNYPNTGFMKSNLLKQITQILCENKKQREHQPTDLGQRELPSFYIYEEGHFIYNLLAPFNSSGLLALAQNHEQK